MTFTVTSSWRSHAGARSDTAPNVAVLFNETDGPARAATLLKTIGRTSCLQRCSEARVGQRDTSRAAVDPRHYRRRRNGAPRLTPATKVPVMGGDATVWPVGR